MAPDAFTTIMSSLDPLIVVATAQGRSGRMPGRPRPVHIDPDRYEWLSKANHTYRVGLRAAHLAVHFLTDADLALAERFGTLTGDETDKFAGCGCAQTGGVRCWRTARRLILRRVVLLDEGGDHVCVTGAGDRQARAVRAAPAVPGPAPQAGHGPGTAGR